MLSSYLIGEVRKKMFQEGRKVALLEQEKALLHWPFYCPVQLQVHDDEAEEGTTEVNNLEVTDELHRSSFCGVLWVKSLMGAGLRENRRRGNTDQEYRPL